MERRTIVGGGVCALALLALVCIPRHLPSSASQTIHVPANFHAHLEAGTLTLRGSLPDAAAHDRILEQARTTYDARRIRIIDQVTIDGRIASSPWVTQVPGVVSVLGHMDGRGSIIIDGHFLVLSGRVPSEQTKATVLSLVSPLRQEGLELEDHLSIASPLASPAALQSKIDEILARQQIEFDSNQSTLTVRGRTVLDRLVPVLRQSSSVAIEIGGHTDGFGSPDYNKELSRRRAESVRQYLTAQGVTHPLTAVGYGATRPREPGISRSALQRNRRIELRVHEAKDS